VFAVEIDLLLLLLVLSICELGVNDVLLAVSSSRILSIILAHCMLLRMSAVVHHSIWGMQSASISPSSPAVHGYTHVSQSWLSHNALPCHELALLHVTVL